MQKLEYALCALLALGGAGHLLGTFSGYPIGSEVFVWSLSATAFTFLIVFLQALRIQRPHDRPVTIAATVATIAWLGLALSFGSAAGSSRRLTPTGSARRMSLTGVRSRSYCPRP